MRQASQAGIISAATAHHPKGRSGRRITEHVGGGEQGPAASLLRGSLQQGQPRRGRRVGRRTRLVKQSVKGYERRSSRNFGRYTEDEMDREAPLRPLAELRRRETVREVSDSLSASFGE